MGMDDDFNTSFLTKGSQVEVSSDEDGLNGAWFIATVIHPPPSVSISKKNKSQNHHTLNNLVYVEYHNLLCEDGSSRRLREYANVAYVRPSPPKDDSPGFQLNDLVDAFYRDGWWTGIITQVVDASNFVVTFQNPPDQLQFHFSDLRVHRKWVAGRWVQPEKQRTAGLMFSVGKKVEVSFEGENLRDVWFPAIVLKISGNNSFLVEYQQPGVDEEPALHKVTVDYLHIRPSPPHLKDKNFVLLEMVDAYYDFGWWSGVITKELADYRYNVLLKNTEEEREFIYSKVRPHMEWKGDKWFNTSQGDTDGRTTLSSMIDKIQSSIGVATSIMKETKQTNLDNNSPHFERLKDDDPSKQSNGQPSEGIDSVIINNQAFGKTENLSHGKKVRSKRGKGMELKTPTMNSSRKKGRLANELKSLMKTFGEDGARGELVKPRSEENLENDVECDVMRISRAKKLEQLSSERIPNVAEGDIKQPSVHMAVINKDSESVAQKRKRGRPRKIQPISLDTLDAVHNQNEGDVGSSAVSMVEDSQRKEVGSGTKSLEEKRVEEQKMKIGNHKLKGKRGKRRTISINIESPAQEKTGDGRLEKDSATRNPVEKYLDKDQPLHRLHSVHGPESSERQLDMDGEKLPFVRSASLWQTIQSMEAFRKIPQKPHFRPLLEGVKESVREGVAIGSMVTFSTVVDKTCGLRCDDPRSEIEDSLETLVELESHGFDVEAIRDRLTRLLLIKDKQEELEERSKGVGRKIEEINIQRKKMDEEIDEIDRRIRELEERRRQVLLKKDKRYSEVSVAKAAQEKIEQEMKETGVEFDRLATAPLRGYS